MRHKQQKKNGKLLISRLLYVCAEDQNRTGTPKNERGILSPLRLPIPPLRHGNANYFFEATIGLEPINRDFADRSLSPLGTSPVLKSG